MIEEKTFRIVFIALFIFMIVARKYYEHRAGGFGHVKHALAKEKLFFGLSIVVGLSWLVATVAYMFFPTA